MQGKTHFTIGMATALLITQPATIPGVLATIVAGGVGGKLPDIDLRDKKIEREEVYNSIIDFLFVGAIVAVDYLVGDGICYYISTNWGLKIWIGLGMLIFLCIISMFSSHRSFTHSFVGAILYAIAMYLFCMPITIPFVIGCVSHIVIDLFNKKGMTLFFPIKKRFCLNVCESKSKTSEVLYWIGLASTILFGAILFSRTFQNSEIINENFVGILSINIFGINIFQIYLIFINIITFLGFQRSWANSYKEALAETNKEIRIQLEFETWILNFLAIIGGGVGMMFALLCHGCFPSGYNANWWSICYSSILGWFSVYCYILNPFSLVLNPINWFDSKHLVIYLYLILINVISAFLFWHNRKRHLNEYNLIHSLLWFVGALGGTIGAYPVVIATHRDPSYNYAVFGFPLMFVSQIILIGYLLHANII